MDAVTNMLDFIGILTIIYSIAVYIYIYIYRYYI